ncbi:unnamed protein product [Allacma fusca]|uniref:Mitochondrial carrier protein n=1 Tax=Allacma fusca TaxID=39272 RepID=A0A8J2J771_9HEXA|nr:unnamed protein product [Allacma fusca]
MDAAPSLQDTFIELLAGAAGGMAGLAVGYPADTIKVHQQVRGESLRSATKHIWRNYGIRGFFRGMSVPLITNGAIFAVFFSTYGACLEYFTAQDGRLAIALEQKLTTEDVSTYKEIFVGGCVGGFFQALVASPVEFLKVQMQIHKEKKALKPNVIVRSIIANRGYVGLGHGLGATMWRDIHSHGLYTICYKFYLDHICARDPGIPCIFMAGGIAGVLFWWSCIPMDVVKSKLQADSISNPIYKGTIDCTRKLYRQGGLKPFLRGYSTVVIRAFPANGAIFLVHDSCRSLLEACGICRSKK